jgi:hypothetical protein
MRRTALVAVCLAAATSLALTGCQSDKDKEGKTSGTSASSESSRKNDAFDGMSGAEIAEKALDTTLGVTSLRMRGTVPDEDTGGTLDIDLALNKKGDCVGTLGMKSQGSAELIKTGDVVYMRYDEKFLRAQSEGEPEEEVQAAVDMLAGKWTKMTAAAGDDLSDFCDLDQILDEASDKETHSNAKRGQESSVDGKPALVLRESDSEGRYTLYVATEGEPYILRVDSQTDGASTTVRFSDFDQPVPAQKPKGKIVDIDALTAS